MLDLVRCDICGKVPTISRSHSSRMISHKCKDFHSGWSGRSQVVDMWNKSNSPKLEEGNSSTSDNSAMLEIAARSVVKAFDLQYGNDSKLLAVKRLREAL